MPWIGPASRSCRDGLLAPLAPRTGLLLVTGLLLAGGPALPARDVCAAAFFELAVFFAGFLVDFFLLPAPFFADGLAAAFLRETAFADFVADFLLTLPADFVRPAFFTVDFFFAAGFFRTAAFFVGAFFRDDVFVLNLRLFPEAFLPAVGLRDAAFFLPVPACFCFLLAAFFAGMFHSCRSEKNAELYIACTNMEPYFSAVFRPSAGHFPVPAEHRMFTSPGGDPPRFSFSRAWQKRLESSPMIVRSHSSSGRRRALRILLRRSCPALLSERGDNRFIRRITLHYAHFTGAGDKTS